MGKPSRKSVKRLALDVRRCTVICRMKRVFTKWMYAFTTPVYTGHDFEYYAFSKSNSAEEFDAYISACRERVLYDTGVTARYGDKLLTLSTCEYSQKNGRMVVVARRINE